MKTNSDTPPALYIGLDVHKEQTTVAIADPDCRTEPRLHGNVRTTQHALEGVLRRIAKAHKCTIQDLEVCYEAGGCGMWIARRLLQLKVRCTVVAPSLIPKQPGEKVKTDKKDAKKLARLLRAGELTAVRVPDEVDEALRDLCRGRVDAVDDLRRAKTRLLAMLRRLGFNYQGSKGHWTEEHKSYLRGLTLPLPAHRFVMEELMGQIDQLNERVSRFEARMEALLDTWNKKPIVEALMGFKGFKLIAAMMVVSEIGDFVRFTHPKQLMGYLGLTPGEYSTGTKKKQGSITKAGNPHARWILIECAVHYRPEPKIGPQLSKRQKGLERWIVDLSWKAQNRLHTRFMNLARRKKQYNKVKVAVARELAGFIWELGFKMQSSAK
jgi:transposase